MFSRSNKGTPSENLPVPQAQRRTGKAAPSIISTDLVIVGTLTSTGDVHIDGRVDGDIRSGSTTLGEKASFEGDIVAEDVTIRGRVKGTIRARKVTMASTSHVEGTVLHEALSVEVGAFFQGDCRHSADPLSDVVAKADTQRQAFEPKRDLSVVASNAPQRPESAKFAGNLLSGGVKAAK
jgi:cytoskeletal protein CcmA (bactofilin family)